MSSTLKNLLRQLRRDRAGAVETTEQNTGAVSTAPCIVSLQAAQLFRRSRDRATSGREIANDCAEIIGAVGYTSQASAD